MVYQTARSCAKKRETGHYPQQGGCRRYDGDYERICVGTARRDTLLFILGGDGKRVCDKLLLSILDDLL